MCGGFDAGGNGSIQPKRYRKRCEQQIGMSIQENFAPLLRDCAQLAAAEENTDKRTVCISSFLPAGFARHLYVRQASPALPRNI